MCEWWLHYNVCVQAGSSRVAAHMCEGVVHILPIAAVVSVLLDGEGPLLACLLARARVRLEVVFVVVCIGARDLLGDCVPELDALEPHLEGRLGIADLLVGAD